VETGSPKWGRSIDPLSPRSFFPVGKWSGRLAVQKPGPGAGWAALAAPYQTSTARAGHDLDPTQLMQLPLEVGRGILRAGARSRERLPLGPHYAGQNRSAPCWPPDSRRPLRQPLRSPGNAPDRSPASLAPAVTASGLVKVSGAVVTRPAPRRGPASGPRWSITASQPSPRLTRRVPY